MDEFWHSHITEKSWTTLLDLKQCFQFVLIGGWAVYLYTHALKSRDIDLILDYEELARLRRVYPVVKNERLKKYEARAGEVEIDIYLPHYSNPGLPAEEIFKNSIIKEGICVPSAEILLLLKLNVYQQRKNSAKGEKDRLDIFSMLAKTDLDWRETISLSHHYQKNNLIREELAILLTETSQVPQLELNSHHFSRLKKEILSKLKTD